MADPPVTSHDAPMFFLHGEIDMATAPSMREAIADAVDKGGLITLDVSDVTFMDSMGIHGILQALDRLPSGCIILHGVHGGLQRVIDLTGLDHAEHLHITPCRAAA